MVLHPIRIAGLLLPGLAGMCATRVQSFAQDGMLDTHLQSRITLIGAQEKLRQRLIDQLEFSLPPLPKLCVAPPPSPPLDVHRSLFVHDRATLDGADFSLAKTLGKIAADATAAGATVTAETVFQELWDTQNSPPGLGLGANCTGTVNGFPVRCPRAEGQEATATNLKAAIGSYQPIALVNRLDLAHEGWRNCGEHRIVYGKTAGTGRNFIIFEAVLPNPKPGCREGCLPVARFWAGLSDSTLFDTPAKRAKALYEFYYKGLPGFRPVVHVDHYSAKGVTTGYGSSGSGQIRTNQFMEPLWTLREFKTVIDCGASPCEFDVTPIGVKVNPFGELWDDTSGQSAGAAFRADVLAQLKSLSANSLGKMGYGVQPDQNAGESVSQNSGAPDNYRVTLNQGTSFPGAMSTALATLASQAPAGTTLNLSPTQIANRATALGCGGCHEPSAFGLLAANSIGTAAIPANPANSSWPNSLKFVHVSEFTSNLAELSGPLFGPSAGANSGQQISPALHDVFLPERKTFLEHQLSAKECACRRKFIGFPPSKLKQLLALQDTTLNAFVKPLAKEAGTLGTLKPIPNLSPLTVQAPATAAAKFLSLVGKRDETLESRLSQAGAPAVKLDLGAQAVTLRAATLAKGDARLEHLLRSKEVQQIDRSEPPRRTVTGSYRVH